MIWAMSGLVKGSGPFVDGTDEYYLDNRVEVKGEDLNCFFNVFIPERGNLHVLGFHGMFLHRQRSSLSSSSTKPSPVAFQPLFLYILY